MSTTTTDVIAGRDLWAEYEREQLAQARAMMAYYDGRPLRQAACYALSMLWLSLGGQTLFPVGLLAALMLLVPQLPAWSLSRRLKFTGHRALVLIAFALAGLVFVRARLGLLNPSGSLVGLSLRLQLLPW